MPKFNYPEKKPPSRLLRRKEKARYIEEENDRSEQLSLPLPLPERKPIQLTRETMVHSCCLMCKGEGEINSDSADWRGCPQCAGRGILNHFVKY